VVALAVWEVLVVLEVVLVEAVLAGDLEGLVAVVVLVELAVAVAVLRAADLLSLLLLHYCCCLC